MRFCAHIHGYGVCGATRQDVSRLSGPRTPPARDQIASTETASESPEHEAANPSL